MDEGRKEKESKKAVGRFLKSARINLGATQADAAVAVGISVPQIKQYEAGSVMPSLNTALKFCYFYDVGWDALGEVIAKNLGGGGANKFDMKSGDEGLVTEVTNANEKLESVINLSRTDCRDTGRHIVISRLADRGWDVTNVNATRRVQPNFDLKAERGGKVLRLMVSTLQHDTKTSLSIPLWEMDQPTFNCNGDAEPADYLVMVRFTNPNDNECFILKIEEAEKKADWMAQKIIGLGNVPMYLQPYTGGPRDTRFKFNVRKVWEPYSEAWESLDEDTTPVPKNTPFPSLKIRVPDENAVPPARSGTDRYKRFKILRTLNGKTVRDYYKACREAGIPCQKNNPVLAHKKGFIILTSP
jgi:transcriptional regulator with XRE-family HTH domain